MVSTRKHNEKAGIGRGEWEFDSNKDKTVILEQNRNSINDTKGSNSQILTQIVWKLIQSKRITWFEY